MNAKAIVGIIAIIFGGTAFAETIVATCSNPKGWRVDFGETEINSGKYPVESADGFSGSTPQFIYDSSKPTFLTEVTDPIDVVGIQPSIVEKMMPSEIKQYRIIAADRKYIFAVEILDNALWTYALYPDLGFMVMGRNTAWGFTRGENAVGATYYATCKIVRG